MGQTEIRPADIAEARSHGLREDDARLQWALLAQGRTNVDLEAPCTSGNGIDQLSEQAHGVLLDHWREASRIGRILKFVPASGAASRMFELLLQELAQTEPLTRSSLRSRRAQGDEAAGEALVFLDNLHRFAFFERFEAESAGSASLLCASDSEDLRPALAEMLMEESSGYAKLPKGLVEFHREGGKPHTAAEQQIAEAARVTADRDGIVHAHFTVPPGATEIFRSHLEHSEAMRDLRLDLGFSEQSPSTDTLSLDEDGQLFRDAGGHLLLRRGGHGALLANLQALDADLVLVKNIDNVQPEGRRQPSIMWQRLLLGKLIEIQNQVRALLLRLRPQSAHGEVLGQAHEFFETTFSPLPKADSAAELRALLIDRLERPLRVCGMVPNAGQPGGGPFWVPDEHGQPRKHIVETSEIDSSEDQQRILRSATHFNPVLLALALRDSQGRAFDLSQWVENRRYFHSHKSHQGRPLRALERPGLWNGSMSGWNTVFVEVPLAVFTPVKTVLDLLEPEHQPA